MSSKNDGYACGLRPAISKWTTDRSHDSSWDALFLSYASLYAKKWLPHAVTLWPDKPFMKLLQSRRKRQRAVCYGEYNNNQKCAPKWLAGWLDNYYNVIMIILNHPVTQWTTALNSLFYRRYRCYQFADMVKAPFSQEGGHKNEKPQRCHRTNLQHSFKLIQ